MAADTIARNVHVIEVRGYPAHGTVTIVAGVTARYMCLIFADGDNAVMTATASTDNLCVVNRHHRREYVGCMTIFTNIGCLNMCCVLARCIRAVVAAHAIARDIDVIEVRR